MINAVEKNIELKNESVINEAYIENLKSFPPVFLNNQEIQKMNEGNGGFNFKEAFALYNEFMETNNEISKTDFLNKVTNLKSKIKNNGGSFSLFSNSPTETAAVIENSFAIVILSQAYSLTNDNTYLETVNNLIESFQYPVEKRGFRKYYSDLPFYTDNTEKSKMILSNHLYALSALYYANKATGNENAKLYFNQGIEALKVSLKAFDADFTSLYSMELSENGQYAFASVMGEDPDLNHELVVKQLVKLYLETGEPICKEYAHLFLKQDMGAFSFLSATSKFSKVQASHSVDDKTFGDDYLDDELWSWGKYWSTNQFPTDLIVEFPDEKKDIEALTFVSIKETTSHKIFKIYISKNEEWLFAYDSSDFKRLNKNYYFTGNYESYIISYILPKKIHSSAIKIEFLDSYSSNLIT